MANYDQMRKDVLSGNTNNKWVVPSVVSSMTLEQMLTNRDLLYKFQEFWSQKISEQTGGAFSGDKRAITNISAILDFQNNQIEAYNSEIETQYPGMSAYYPDTPAVCTLGNEAEPDCKEAIRAQAVENIALLQSLPPGSYIDPTTGDVVNVEQGGGPDYGLYVLIGLGVLVGIKILSKPKKKAA